MTRTMNDLYINHPVSASDLEAVKALRDLSAPYKGMLTNPQARASYDQMMEQTVAAEGVDYRTVTLGGVPGEWCRVGTAQPDAAILYLHGGGYVVGSAKAYRHLGGQFAVKTGVDVFIADYALAPEHPFPAGLNQAKAAYASLIESGYRRIAVVGDSAGGGLSLSLIAQDDLQRDALACCAVMSPWTDLTLSGASHVEKADEELYLTYDAVSDLARLYLNGQAAKQPSVSPLFGSFKDLPPTQIHVGTAEILLSDSLEYTERAVEAGASVETHVWEAMPHVFTSGVTQLEAADRSLALMSDFIATHLAK